MTIHIAGQQVDIGGRYLRQRCSWCGAVLIDYDLAMMGEVIRPEEPTPPPMWEVGRLVLCDGPLSTLVEHKDGERLPSASCVTVELDRHEVALLEAWESEEGLTC